ncbi:hypothetical protein GCM10010387_39540 [Streptomyces inusitatus]|uniref:Chaplin domain-containing protein n=1 Tax=Streptomyces inusitatus TaxID=68221 RepID=A0A918QE36_9ACTN|nr:chaplin [Streptomyces inusitatus]GGZ41330.1 hypothetical protein GCM10010387_39540 [Streptomyces inusitatus]
MRQVTRKGLITMAAAGGALALGGGYAHAGAEAYGGASNSPGVASGNSVQVPVSVPVNACGNSVNAIALLNPSFGNNCANVDNSPGPVQPAKPGGGDTAGPQPGGSPSGGVQAGGGSHAGGGTHNSPGVASGNNVQAPIDVPVNACGNSVNLGGLLNPTFGNDCANVSEANPPGKPAQPGKPTPPVEPTTPGNPPPVTPPGLPGEPPTTRPSSPGDPGVHGRTTTNAHKANSSRIVEQPRDVQLAQTGADSLGLIIPVGAGMMLAGAVLYRRARVRA